MSDLDRLVGQLGSQVAALQERLDNLEMPEVLAGLALDTGGQGSSVSTTTLTTSYQTLSSVTLTVPGGGGTILLIARVHVDQATYGATHIESRLVVGAGTQLDYARERAIDVASVEYNTPLMYVGSVTSGSKTFSLQSRKNVNNGSFSATSDPRSALWYVLFS